MVQILKILNKYKHMSVPAKAAVWYTLCNLFQKGISFIIIPIYTRILTTAEYGEYSSFQAWSNILVIFATLNLYCGVFTKAMVDKEGERDCYTSSMQGLSTILTSVLFLIYSVAHNFWDSILQMGTITIILMFVYFIFYPAFSFWSVRQRVEYKYKLMVIVTLMVSIATPLVSILLLYMTSLRADAVIWGYLFVQILVGGYLYIYQFIRGRVFYNKKYWLYAIRFNVPLIPHYLSLIILGQADRIMIKEYCGKDKTGIYSLAYQVSMLMNIFVNAINNSLVPWTYEKMKQKEYQSIKTVTKKLCIAISVMTIMAVLVAPEIVYILGGRQYLAAIWVIPAVALSVYFTFCYGLFSNVEFYFGETKFVMAASVIGALLNIVLNVLFIPKVGFIAAGYTTLVCYLVFMIMHFLFMRRICVNKITGEIIYDIKFIVISCMIISMGAGISMLLYNTMIFRYVIIGLGCVVCLKKRQVFIDLLSSVK